MLSSGTRLLYRHVPAAWEYDTRLFHFRHVNTFAYAIIRQILPSGNSSFLYDWSIHLLRTENLINRYGWLLQCDHRWPNGRAMLCTPITVLWHQYGSDIVKTVTRIESPKRSAYQRAATVLGDRDNPAWTRRGQAARLPPVF
jgi:hypothetical protein